ncbi:Gfo/Idh/MocA family protein [Brachybacterium sp. DNPG3]
MTIRIIHVGLGGWGGDWARTAIPAVEEIEVAAIADPSEATLAAVQEALGLSDEQAFPSLTAALAAVEADAVVITAPAVTHAPLALEALAAGKHVIVEKPFANSLAEAAEVAARAEELGLVVQVSQNYRNYPAPRAAQRLLAEGAIGEVASLSIDFRQWDNDKAFDAHPHYRFPHPLLYDMAIHHVDLLRKVTGQEAVRVYTKVKDPSFSKYVEEAQAVMTIEMADGLVVSYRGSWVDRGEPTPWAGEWRVSGELGELSFTSRGGGAYADPTEKERVTLRLVGEEPQEIELEDMELLGRAAGLRIFADAIENGTVPETSGRANLGSLALMEAAARSAASGQVEEVVIP